MLSRTLLLALLPAATFAHFQIVWPTARGFSEDTIVDYPCGGFNTPNTTRTAVPFDADFPIQLNMEHTSVKGRVVLALGNNPTGDDFTIVLKQNFQETGPESFCIGDVMIPGNLNITEGTNATILVLTNGDPSGGLYNCADVTFTRGALSQADYSSHCTNSSGVSASLVGGASPNGTASSSGSSSSSAASSGAAASATKSAFAPQQTVAGLLLGAAGIIGGLAVL